MREGELVASRFQVGRLAGAGAMGFVFEGRDLERGAAVAIKVLRTASPDLLARFAREGAVLAAVSAPEIARYVAHGVTESGELYLVMEWLTGESLQERLARAPLCYGDLVSVAQAVARALEAAHAAGVIHRDLKPANVMLVANAASPAERVKVVDFGVARARGEHETITGTGDMIGTLAYMSPEQAAGARDLDARTDLFALGAITYRAIVGTAPFEAGDTLRTLQRLATERAAPLASVANGVPPRLARLVDALLSVDRDARPADARAVVAELGRVEAELGDAARASPEGLAFQPTLLDRSRSREVPGARRALVGAGVVALLAGVAGGGAWWWSSVERSPARRSTEVSEPAVAPSSVASSSAPIESASRAPRTLDGWPAYRDPSGAFEAKLECKPHYKLIPRYTEAGATLERSMASCDSKRGFMSVSVSDVLAGATMGCEVANRMSEEFALQAVKCSASSRSEVTMSAFTGAELMVSCPGHKMRGAMRFLCDPKLVASGKGRALVVQFLRFESEWDPDEARLFWQSFKPFTLP